MGLLNPHLDDDAFAQVWTDRTLGDLESSRQAEKHLDGCAECRVRFASFTQWLQAMSEDARAEADHVFGPDRLTAQQAQILRRLESLEHPARVIAFPRFAQPIAAPRMPRRRWVAVAAAAGLVVGVGLGRVMEFGASSVGQPDPQIVASVEPLADATRVAAQPVSLPGDEVFLYNDPAATTFARVPESLQYLNAITPTSRDFDPR